LISLGDPDGNTYDTHHQLLDCASYLRAIIRLSRTGKIHVLADQFRGKRFNQPQRTSSSAGRRDLFYGSNAGPAEGPKKRNSISGCYRLDSRGRVTLLTSELSQPNGLAFSPDGTRLYVDDSEKRNIRVYDFQPGGTFQKRPHLWRGAGTQGEGVPDGMKVDLAGNLFVTGPGGIWVWDPSGRHLGTF